MIYTINDDHDCYYDPNRRIFDRGGILNDVSEPTVEDGWGVSLLRSEYVEEQIA